MFVTSRSTAFLLLRIRRAAASAWSAAATASDDSSVSMRPTSASISSLCRHSRAIEPIQVVTVEIGAVQVPLEQLHQLVILCQERGRELQPPCLLRAPVRPILQVRTRRGRKGQRLIVGRTLRVEHAVRVPPNRLARARGARCPNCLRPGNCACLLISAYTRSI